MTITDYLRQIRENAWSSRQLGTEFERFVKRYLKVEPSYASQFSDVWLWSECPFAKGSDVGIDLVARTNFGEYVAIQAKCYQPGTQVDKADVDTFLSASPMRTKVKWVKSLWRFPHSVPKCLIYVALLFAVKAAKPACIL